MGHPTAGDPSTTFVAYVPVMDPTARLVADYLERRDPHTGLGADADPLFHGPNHTRLTRSGIASSWPATSEPSERATPAGLPAFRSRPTHFGVAGRCT